MDNLTHTLAGLAMGEFIHQNLKKSGNATADRTRREVLLTASVLANNLPDIDLILSPLIAAPLGYLLHHRGHTHTFLLAIPQALLVAFLLYALWPQARAYMKNRTAVFTTLLTPGIGFTLHILMDSMNVYGTHPFFPFYNGWIYGDLVFILEPVLWVTLGLGFTSGIESRWRKYLFTFTLLAVVSTFTILDFLNWKALVALLAIGSLILTIQYFNSSTKRALNIGILLSLLFVGTQFVFAFQARRNLEKILLESNSNAQILDIALSAFPTHPFCWIFSSVELQSQNDEYRLRKGVYKLGEGNCPSRLSPVTLENSIAIEFDEKYQLSKFRELQKNNCHFESWLRFARIPAVDDVTASDIRFSLAPAQNFTTLVFGAFNDFKCPEKVPPWEFPRKDLF